MKCEDLVQSETPITPSFFFLSFFLLKHFYDYLDGSCSLSDNVDSNPSKTLHICYITFTVLTLLQVEGGGVVAQVSYVLKIQSSEKQINVL